MNRRQHRLPTYRLHRPSGRAVVTIAGRDHYLGPHGTQVSRREYDRLVAEWIAAGRPQVPADTHETTVVELCRDYLLFAKSHYQANGRPTGEIAPLKSAVRLLRIRYGEVRVGDFGPLSLKGLRQQMIAEGWSRGTVNAQTNRVRRIFRWGVSEEKVPVSVIQALDTVGGLRAGKCDARETEPIQPVADSLVEMTIPRLPEVVADMVRLQRLTGARPSEICSLRPADVEVTGEVWQYRPTHHKASHRGRPRVISIGPKGQAILRPYLDRPAEEFCFSPAESEVQRRQARELARTTPLQQGNRSGTNRVKKPHRTPGQRYSANSYRRAVQRACSAAKVEVWSPHQLRHTAGTEIRQRFGLEAAQVALGHSHADVTQIYAERDLSLAAKVMKQLG